MLEYRRVKSKFDYGRDLHTEVHRNISPSIMHPSYQIVAKIQIGIGWVPRKGGVSRLRKKCKTKATRAGPGSKLPGGPAPKKN